MPLNLVLDIIFLYYLYPIYSHLFVCFLVMSLKALDVNDNSPIFGGPYSCEILENSPTSTTVCYVTATDADSGNNAKLSYTISSSSSGTCPFTIQSVSACAAVAFCINN